MGAVKIALVPVFVLRYFRLIVRKTAFLANIKQLSMLKH